MKKQKFIEMMKKLNEDCAKIINEHPEIGIGIVMAGSVEDKYDVVETNTIIIRQGTISMVAPNLVMEAELLKKHLMTLYTDESSKVTVEKR